MHQPARNLGSVGAIAANHVMPQTRSLSSSICVIELSFVVNRGLGRSSPYLLGLFCHCVGGLLRVPRSTHW